MSLHITRDPKATATLIEQFTWELEWRPERTYPAGSRFQLRSHCLRAFFTWSFTRIEVDGADVVWRWKSAPTVSDQQTNHQYRLLECVLPYGARSDHPVRLRITAIPQTYVGIDNRLSIWIAPGQSAAPWAGNGEIVYAREADSEAVLTYTAGPVERLMVYCRPAPGADATVRAILSPQDRFGNPSAFAKPIQATLDWDGAKRSLTLQEPVVLSLPAPTATIGRAVLHVPLVDLVREETVENGILADGIAVVTGNPVWRDLPEGLRPAFGEIHWHTDHSGDGQRPIREAIRCARDELNHDFTAPADHGPAGERWTDTVAALNEANADDAFATFFGWEASSSEGHDNFYFTAPDHPMVCGGSAGITGGKPAELVEKLKAQADFMAICHHTNAVAESRRVEDDVPFWFPHSLPEPMACMRQMEIMQARGNQERNQYSDAWRGWHQHNGASFQDALAKGYRIGVTGGTDNHCGWPGRAFADCEGLGRHPAWSEILTGIWTPAVRRQEVYESLYARHTWAVWDTRALVEFRVGGALMGSELVAAAGAKLAASIRISAQSSLRTVEIVSEGTVVWRHSSVNPDLDITADLGPVTGSTHFYLRALEHAGGIIYASPVFVDVR